MFLPSRSAEGTAGARRARPQAALGDGDGILRAAGRRPRAAGRLAIVPTRAMGRRAKTVLDHGIATVDGGAPPTLPDVNPDYVATDDGVVFHLFPDRLKLTDETIVGKEKWDKVKGEIDSEGANKLCVAVISSRRSISTTAICRPPSSPTPTCAACHLTDATMRGANLGDARLDGARLCRSAQLARRQPRKRAVAGRRPPAGAVAGRRPQHAQLQGADLSDAQLQDADLAKRSCRAPTFEGAHLQGADLRDAQLQGANLESAHLQGANLQQRAFAGRRPPPCAVAERRPPRRAVAGRRPQRSAQLQGADLILRVVAGRQFFRAQLQGADLSRANLADSYFNEVFVFRTNIVDANLATAAIHLVHADEVKLGKDGRVEPLEQREVDGWIASATQFAAEKDKGAVKQRFDRLKWSRVFKVRAGRRRRVDMGHAGKAVAENPRPSPAPITASGWRQCSVELRLTRRWRALCRARLIGLPGAPQGRAAWHPRRISLARSASG